MIPTSTGAAKAIGEVYPHLKGKLDGIAIRVPTVNGSVVDSKFIVENATTAEEVNAKMKAASEGSLKGILAYNPDPIVSSDIIGDPHSSIFSPLWTKVYGNFIAVLSYYDNEWGYSSRLVDLIAKKL
jgi:glyceraldehyde 3-phosphate dehydrogenase